MNLSKLPVAESKSNPFEFDISGFVIEKLAVCSKIVPFQLKLSAENLSDSLLLYFPPVIWILLLRMVVSNSPADIL